MINSFITWSRIKTDPTAGMAMFAILCLMAMLAAACWSGWRHRHPKPPRAITRKQQEELLRNVEKSRNCSTMSTKALTKSKPTTKTTANDTRNYPRINDLGIVMVDDDGVPCIPWHELKRVLNKELLKEFDKFFGVQTCSPDGLYAWDVEAVLERMKSGKVVGTQALWD